MNNKNHCSLMFFTKLIKLILVECVRENFIIYTVQLVNTKQCETKKRKKKLSNTHLYCAKWLNSWMNNFYQWISYVRSLSLSLSLFRTVYNTIYTFILYLYIKKKKNNERIKLPSTLFTLKNFSFVCARKLYHWFILHED